MKLTSYWLDTAPKGSPERSKTTVEGRTDVAVIGRACRAARERS